MDNQYLDDLMIAIQLRESGFATEASKMMQPIYENNPQNQYVLYEYASTLFRDATYHKAQQVLQDLLQINPAHEEAKELKKTLDDIWGIVKQINTTEAGVEQKQHIARPQVPRQNVNPQNAIPEQENEDELEQQQLQAMGLQEQLIQGDSSQTQELEKTMVADYRQLTSQLKINTFHEQLRTFYDKVQSLNKSFPSKIRIVEEIDKLLKIETIVADLPTREDTQFMNLVTQCREQRQELYRSIQSQGIFSQDLQNSATRLIKDLQMVSEQYEMKIEKIKSILIQYTGLFQGEQNYNYFRAFLTTTFCFIVDVSTQSGLKAIPTYLQQLKVTGMQDSFKDLLLQSQSLQFKTDGIQSIYNQKYQTVDCLWEQLVKVSAQLTISKEQTILQRMHLKPNEVEQYENRVNIKKIRITQKACSDIGLTIYDSIGGFIGLQEGIQLLQIMNLKQKELVGDQYNLDQIAEFQVEKIKNLPVFKPK